MNNAHFNSTLSSALAEKNCLDSSQPIDEFLAHS